MSQLKRNLVANSVGQGWVAIMGLAFVPLYIRYLGMEAYGLIGLFAVMQAWLSLLDMGITPTLNREMARYTAGAHSTQSIRDLLRSLEIICLVIAALICFGVWQASDFLAGEWLKADKLPTAVVRQAISVMGIVVALRFVEGIYRGSLYGLQRQVWYNGASAILATLRHGGAVAVVALISPSVKAFFLWQGVISLLSVAVFASSVHRTLPTYPLPARFSRVALADVWKFASGMMGITFLALLLTQIDKVLLSRMLSLESFGSYVLAGTVASGLYAMISPVTQAILPRMVELFTQDDQTSLVDIYHKGAQVVTVLTAPVTILMCLFAKGVVFLWSGNTDLAENVAPILSPLVLGTFLNCLMWVPYQCQLAHGWTSFALKTNIVAVLAFVPAIVWVVPPYGAVGAAWVWVMLNAGYVLISIQFMHKRVLKNEKWRWYLSDVLLPLIGSLGVFFLALYFEPLSYQYRWQWLVFFMISGSLALTTSIALASSVRSQLISLLRTFLRRQPLDAKGPSKRKVSRRNA